MSGAKIILIITAILLSASILLAQPAQSPRTFCNPLNLNYRFMVDATDAREAADPVIILFKDDYYLFASRSGGYWTSPDLRNWTLIVPSGLDIETYAPAVVVIGDTLIYIPSNVNQSYKTADPKSGIWTAGPTVKNYGDPDLFLNDDGRLYMYYGLSNVDPIRVVELNPATLQEIGSPVVILSGQAAQHGWERRGDDNLLDEQPWIEGSWMVKENDKYYLHYAAPGTEWKTYADGIYVADSAKGPFTYATYSPVDFKPTGFICGAGHGCTFRDKEGQYWHIGTMTISIKHMFERRLGLFPVGFSEDGDIHTNTVWGDYPQYLPGENENPADDNFAGMMLLSRKKYAMASSSLADHGVQYAVDEDARTYWCAQSGDSTEWLTVDLGKECTVQAVQINFAEHNTDPNMVRGRTNVIYEQYLIYTSTDGMTWSLLIDKSQNMQDVPHDYLELEQETTTRYLKIKNVYTPGNGLFAIRDLRVFGNSAETVFTSIDDFTVERSESDGRDAIIRWTPVENADGYLIRYGIAENKLFNHYLVYETDSVAIHSLNNGVEYYFSVEAFDNGTDYYIPAGEIRSYKSGDWNDTDNWEQNDGTAWIHPVPAVPGYAAGPVTILSGHTMTVSAAADTVDQLTVADGGTLVINPGITFNINDGIETDMMVEGTVKNFGSLEKQAPATITFANNGVYLHELNGGSLPSCIWRPNSICQMDSIVGTAPANRNQDFYSVLWNCPRQNTNLNMGWNGNTIGGDIIIQNTGTARWYMCAPAVGNSAAVNINGDIIQSGGQFSSNGTGNDATTIIINQKGDINVTGGNFAISRGGQGGDAGTGLTIWNLLGGNVSLSNATTQNSCPRAKFVFSKDDGTQTLSFTDVTFSGGFPVEVDSSTTLDFGTNILRGSGIFNLKAGATLQTAHQAGLDSTLSNTGVKTLSPGANYSYNGTLAQVTGLLLPATVGNLTIDNSAGLSLSGNTVVNGTLELKKGSLVLAGNILSYGQDGSLKYSGSTTRTTSDAEFPVNNGPRNLIPANSGGVVLHASRSIVNLILSGRLRLDNNNLTADSIEHAATNRWVVTNGNGFLKLTAIGAGQKFFPVGTSVYAPAWISNSGVADTIGVSVVGDGTSATYPRVRVKWNVIENNPGGGNYTLQLGWVPSLENTSFRDDRKSNARIFNLTDTTEAGSGEYTNQFITQPYTVSRSNITALGPMGVGSFDQAVGISEEEVNVSPTFNLSQNYPNPFNPVTKIKYEIPKQSHVIIYIFDILGRKVATLFDGQQLAGKYELEWRATNVASGIYFYSMRAGDFSDTKKLVLLR